MVLADLIDTLSRIGAIGGILSILGTGLLILLVAGQSRQIRSMREWIDEEPRRQQETAQRVIAEVQRRIAAARERRVGQSAPPPVPAAATGRKPAPGTLGATPEAQAIAAKVETPAAVGAGEPTQVSGSVPPPATTAGGADAPAFAPLIPAGGDDPSGEEQPAVVSEFLNQETQAADALPESDLTDPSASAAASQVGDIRFGDEHYDDEHYETVEEPRSNRLLFGGGVVALLAGIVLLGVLVFGGDDKTATDGGTASTETAEATTPRRTTPAASTTIDPTTVNVRVFNGTTVSGLAQRVTDNLKNKGYVTGSPETFTAAQTLTATTVSFRPNFKAAATQVAKDLGLTATSVQAIDQDRSVAAGETAEVVVVTGTDLNTSSTPSASTE